MSDDKDIMDRIVQEWARLSRELVYLDIEEAKLTKQDAPISLSERGIELTQHRLAEVNMAIDDQLEPLFAKLSASQVALLRSLVTPSGRKQALLPEEQECRQSDLEALAKVGLVHVEHGRAEIIHDLVARYVVRRFGAA